MRKEKSLFPSERKQLQNSSLGRTNLSLVTDIQNCHVTKAKQKKCIKIPGKRRVKKEAKNMNKKSG